MTKEGQKFPQGIVILSLFSILAVALIGILSYDSYHYRTIVQEQEQALKLQNETIQFQAAQLANLSHNIASLSADNQALARQNEYLNLSRGLWHMRSKGLYHSAVYWMAGLHCITAGNTAYNNGDLKTLQNSTACTKAAIDRDYEEVVARLPRETQYEFRRNLNDLNQLYSDDITFGEAP